MPSTLKSSAYDFFVLVYGRIYYSTVKLRVSKDMARFAALAQLSLLLTLNLMAVVFFAHSATSDSESAFPFWISYGSLVVKVGLLAAAFVFFVLLRRLTVGFSDEEYCRINRGDASRLVRHLATAYPYVVLALLAGSIVTYA